MSSLPKADTVIPEPMVTEEGSSGLSVIAISESPSFNKPFSLSDPSTLFKLASNDLSVSNVNVNFIGVFPNKLIYTLFTTVSLPYSIVLAEHLATYRVLRTQPIRYALG